MGHLFPHNQKVYDIVLSHFQVVNKVAVVQATGTGKGFLASEFVNVAFKGKNILILAPNEDILTNYKKSLGVKEGGNIKLLTYPTIMSWYKRANNNEKEAQDKILYILNKIDLLIVDEFHRLGAKEWGSACKFIIDKLDKKGKKILGLTATPVRYNDLLMLSENDLSLERFEKNKKGRNMADEIFEGNVVQGVSLEEAVYLGILPSFKYVLGTYGYEKAIQEGYEKLADMRELYGAGHQGIRKLESNLEKITKEFGPEKENLRKLIQGELGNHSKDQKWIVFCSNSEQLKEIDSDLSYWFEKGINKYSNNFVNSLTDINLYCVYGEESKDINKKNLEAFYDAKEGLHIIKCINKLNEGAHVPNVTGIIMLRGTQSPIIYLQQIGRALSAGNKNMPIIFDFMGNIENMNKVCMGEDAYYNTMKGFAKNLENLKTGITSCRFIEGTSSGFKQKEPKIIIKDNKVISLSRLFGEIQDILRPHSSIMWSEVELNILDYWFPRGGVKAVKDEFSRKVLTTRSEDAIKAKARERGLLFDKDNVIVNKDNTLRWTEEEDYLIKDAFETMGKTRSSESIASMLHRNYLFNREVDQIINRYQHIKNGRSAKNVSKEYPRNGLKWTDNDIFILRDYYKSYFEFKEKFGVSGVNNPYHLSGISKVLERSPEAILTKAQSLGLYFQERELDTSVPWREEELEFLNENYGKIPISELSEILGRSPSAIDKKVRREKLNKNSKKLKEKMEIPRHSGLWDDYEEALLNRYWGEDWDLLCSKISSKTPKQIKTKINKECKDYNLPHPYKNDIKFKNVV